MFLFKHITNATSKALDDGMKQELHYKDIYNSVKDDLVKFGSGLRLELNQ